MKYILQQYNKYTQMQLMDFVKLLYQANFGCEHIFSDKMVDYIDSEMNACGVDNGCLFEPISDTFCRVNLASYKAIGGNAQALGKCMKSVKSTSSKEQLCRQLDQLLSLIKDGTIALDYNQSQQQIQWYKQQGCPAIHHSSVYRDNYNPHYRVVYTRQAMLLPAILLIEQKLSQKLPVIVGIDGPCGSGKSTLAGVLADYFSATIVHADCFFLPPQMRSEQRIRQGENLHWEALLPVIHQAKQGKDFVYQAYNCQTNSYQDITFNSSSCTIVEGSYSFVKNLFPLYDITILLQVNSQNQLDRLRMRQGNTEQYVNKWIVYEQYHLQQVPSCDIVIDTNLEAL